jgi:3',5'-cyclic AMP phosphodiesterase CpdA
MLTLLQISDLHFGAPYLPRVGEALQRIAPALRADAIIVSGDLTQRARPEQFRQAREFIDQLPHLPRLAIPGNHDVPLYRVWERITDPLGEYRRHIGTDVDQVMELDDVVIVALNTTAPHRTITRGQVGPEQIEFTRRALAGAPASAARVLVAHHHFVGAPDRLRDRNMLGGRRAMRAFIEMGIDVILGGHLHRAYIGNSLDFFFEGPRDRGIIIVQSGTSTSRHGRGRERERNSFNLVEIHHTWLQITHYLYYEKTDAFSPMSRHRFPRTSHGLEDHRQLPPDPETGPI